MRIEPLLTGLLLLGLLPASMALAKDFSARYTTAAACCGPDLNQDGEPGNRSLGEGRSNRGRFSEDTVLDFDLTGIRPATPELCENSDSSVVVPIIAGSSVYRFRDGSLQYRNVARDGRESYSCFDFVAQQATKSVVSVTISGGSGRFDGISGMATQTCSFPAALDGLVVIECIESGQINR